MTLNEGGKIQQFLPPQITQGLQKKMSESLEGGRLVLTKNPYINYLIALLIQYVWSLLDDLSFLTILTMLSITVPGVASMI